MVTFIVLMMTKILLAVNREVWEYFAMTVEIGTQVEKVGGDYKFTGIVVSVFKKKSGVVRVVVENPDGILHIFNPAQLTEWKGGWKCVGCNCSKPMDHYVYEAINIETREITAPLCARCIRGETSIKYSNARWEHIGPLVASTYKFKP